MMDNGTHLVDASGVLREALHTGSLIICAGPAIDVAAGLPSVDQLVQTLLSTALEVEPDSVDGDFVREVLDHGRHGDAFQYLQHVLGRATFTRCVVDQLGSGYSVAPIVASIARLHEHLRAVYTTSLVDGIFTRAFRGRWPTHDEPRPYLAQKRRHIFHLRGTLGHAESWVLTAEDEHLHLCTGSARGDLLSTVYKAHRLLLLGFDIDGPAMRSILDMLPPVHSELAPEHFVIVTESCSKQARRRLGRRGFQVLTGDPERLLLALNNADEVVEAASPTGECPYPGLEPFDEGRADLFFGRHVEVSEAAARLGEQQGREHRRWLAVEGPSGVGKSSFVHAGIVPALRSGFADTPQRWTVARMRPGNRPLGNLIDAVWDGLGLDESEAGGREAMALQTKERPSAVAELISRRTPQGHGFLLVVDQLEEAVTFSTESEREPFGLAVAASLDVSQFYLVTTMRTDFVPTFQARLPSLASLLNGRAERYSLPPINRVGLREAIVEPAVREGVTIEPELVELMLADADDGNRHNRDDGGEGHASKSTLPLVAHVLRALWDAGAADDRVIEVSKYRALGGISAAVSRSAEAAIDGLDEATLERAEALLLGLVRVHPGGGETRRSLERDEAVALAGGGGRGEELLLRLSGVLGADGSAKGARLLVVHTEGQQQRVDIVHEALLRDWDRYRGLIDQNRRQLLLDDELERRARRWNQAGRPHEEHHLPAGLELEELLEGRPRGPDAQLQRRYQGVLRRAEQRRQRIRRWRRLTWISVLGAFAVAATSVAVVIYGQNIELDDAIALLANSENKLHEKVEALDHKKTELEQSEEKLKKEVRVQKGLRASTLAEVPGQEIGALQLAIEGFGFFDPFARPPGAVFAGVIDATVRAWPVRTLGADSGAKIDEAAFSPDGSRIVTAGFGARLWDVPSGELTATLGGASDLASDAVFSPDGAHIATANYDGTARIWNAFSGELTGTLEGHTATLRGAEFSPDGTLVATFDILGAIRLWDMPRGELKATLEGHEQRVTDLVFSPDSSQIVTGSADGTARLWNTSGRLVATLDDRGQEVTRVAFSLDGSRIATAGHDGIARLWNASSGEPTHTLEGHRQIVQDLAFSPDGSWIATASTDGTARLWDANTGEPTTVLQGHTQQVTRVAFSPDGSRIATGSEDTTVRLWDSLTGRPIVALKDHTSLVSAVSFSPDGSLATSSWDGTTRLWGTAFAEPTTLLGHKGTVSDVTFLSGDSHVATSSYDRTMRLWDATTAEPTAVLRGHEGAVWRLALSPDGSRVATSGPDGTAQLWDAQTGELTNALHDLKHRVADVAFSPDGSRLATAGSDGMTGLWDASTGEFIDALQGHTDLIFSVAYSPDGSRIATASRDDTTRLWDSATGGTVAILDGKYRQTVTAFSPDGFHFATGGEDGLVGLWDMVSGDPIASLKGHTKAMNAMAFSPDGSRLATASANRTARLWDAVTGESVELRGHMAGVLDLAFSPDGSYVATASNDGTVRLWDGHSGKPSGTFEGHASGVVAVAFSADGSHLVSGSRDGTARIWDTTPVAWLERGCNALDWADAQTDATLAACPPSPIRTLAATRLSGR